jgi:hypothetical protein
MKALFVAATFLLAIAFAGAASAKEVDCSAAERSLAKPFSSWREAHSYYERFDGGCSDGDLAEALGVQFTQLLSNRWEHLPELEQLASREPAFLEWVLLGVYYDPEEVEINASNTACRLLKRLQSCQLSQRALCERLATRVGPSREYIQACGA